MFDPAVWVIVVGSSLPKKTKGANFTANSSLVTLPGIGSTGSDRFTTDWSLRTTCAYGISYTTALLSASTLGNWNGRFSWIWNNLLRVGLSTLRSCNGIGLTWTELSSVSLPRYTLLKRVMAAAGDVKVTVRGSSLFFDVCPNSPFTGYTMCVLN